MTTRTLACPTRSLPRLRPRRTGRYQKGLRVLTCTGMSQVSALGLHASLAKCLSVYCLAWASCFTILLCSCYEYHLLLKNAQLSVSVIRGWDELLEHALPRSVVLKASRSVVGQAFTSDLFLYQMQMAICMQPSTAQPTTSPPPEPATEERAASNAAASSSAEALPPDHQGQQSSDIIVHVEAGSLSGPLSCSAMVCLQIALAWPIINCRGAPQMARHQAHLSSSSRRPLHRPYPPSSSNSSSSSSSSSRRLRCTATAVQST